MHYITLPEYLDISEKALFAMQYIMLLVYAKQVNSASKRWW